MRLLSLLSAPLLAVALLAGCSSTVPATGPQADGRVHAGCTVCVHEADLACIDVVVDEKTPHVERDGKTYYFCSEDCRRTFLKHPETYAGK